MHTSTAVYHTAIAPAARISANRVLACVDRSAHAQKIIPHAQAIADALESPLTLLQVLETYPGGDLRPDPVEWDIRRHEARDGLKRLAQSCGEETLEAELAEGRTAEEICRRLGATAGLVVLGTQGEHRGGEQELGSTVRGVLAQATFPVLLVPVGAPGATEVNYRRILLPLDGSSWAESVMPLAMHLAASAGAELIVAHIVPAPELTETGPLEVEDIALRERVLERNERVARAYVERMRRRAAEKGLKVRGLIRHGGDVRTGLADLIAAEEIDLVVLSARGHGRNRPVDLPYGDVAAYLMTHSPAPLLIGRPAGPPARRPDPMAGLGGRLPFRASR